MALSIALRAELPGNPTIPDLIVRNKIPYYDALDASDAKWAKGVIDVTQMEALLRDRLYLQLSSIS